MFFETPAALLSLASIGVLILLWRLWFVRKRFEVPSLIPFERLLAHPLRKRRYLVVNALFWLQLLALLLFGLAQARPSARVLRGETVLVVLDTSASMAAKDGGDRIFDRARAALKRRIGRKKAGDQFFILASAPVEPLTRGPTADGVELARAADRAEPYDLSGNIEAAVRMGVALLKGAVDRVVVVTDESAPGTRPGVEWISVGAPLPNVAIIGGDVNRPLCETGSPKLTVTVKNYSEEASDAQIRLVGADEAERSLRLAPGEERRLSFDVPGEPQEAGALAVRLSAKNDALAVDDAFTFAWGMNAGRRFSLDVADAALSKALGRWLAGCPGIPLSEGPTSDPTAYRITDRAGSAGVGPGTLLVGRDPGAEPVVTDYWMADATHPLTEYLDAVGRIPFRLSVLADADDAAEIPLWGIVGGKRVPLVMVQRSPEERVVYFGIDPVLNAHQETAVIAFFNALRYLLGGTPFVSTGEPIRVGIPEAGTASILRPDGKTDLLAHGSGSLVYSDTTRRGVYRIRQGSFSEQVVVNFLDPLESNLEARAPAWRGDVFRPRDAGERRTAQPLFRLLLILGLAVLLWEWWRYTRSSGG